MYVTNKQPGGLEAGKVYQFQVVAVYVDAEASEEKSRWSPSISFDYISPEPPLFRVARRLVSGPSFIAHSSSRSWSILLLTHRLTNYPTWWLLWHFTAAGECYPDMRSQKMLRLDLELKISAKDSWYLYLGDFLSLHPHPLCSDHIHLPVVLFFRPRLKMSDIVRGVENRPDYDRLG